MTGDKGSDFSSRLGVKRAGKLASKSTKSTISAPPKAAVASSKAKKDEVQRRKNPFNDMLSHKSGKEQDERSSTPSTPNDRENEHQPMDESPSMGAETTQESTTAEKLTELERALETAKEEQDILREELEKVKQHGQVYRDTLEDYRRQLAGTYVQAHAPAPYDHESRPNSSQARSPSHEYLHDNDFRTSMSAQNEDLIQQNHALRSKLAEPQERPVSHNALYQGRPEHSCSRGENEWDELTARLHVTEKESQERLEQLLSLKSSISSLTRMDSQITDSDLTESFSQVANRTREWTISNFRKAKLDFSRIPPHTVTALEAVCPNFEAIDSSNRLALYQALISNMLMYIFGEQMLVGLPETGPLACVRQLALYINNTGTDYHEWQRMTLRCLEKSEVNDMLQHEKEKTLHRLAAEVGHLLFTLTSISLTTQAQSSLIAIFHAAANLRYKLMLQKAQYQVHFFRSSQEWQHQFDEERMEPVNDLDSVMDDGSDTFTERKFAFCVFPCLEKFGDEYGNNVEARNILLKARVCCGVG